jgi:hypothetical protein
MIQGCQIAGLCSLKIICSLENCKEKTARIGLSILSPNFSEISFLVEIWSKKELHKSVLQAIAEFVHPWHMETSVIVESVTPSFYSNLSF